MGITQMTETPSLESLRDLDCFLKPIAVAWQQPQQKFLPPFPGSKIGSKASATPPDPTHPIPWDPHPCQLSGPSETLSEGYILLGPLYPVSNWTSILSRLTCVSLR